MIAEADTNGDGMIDYEEFVAYWRKLMYHTKVNRFARLVRKATGAIGVMRTFMALGQRRQREEEEMKIEHVVMDPAGVGMVPPDRESPDTIPTTTSSVMEIPKRLPSGSNVDSIEYMSLGNRPSDLDVHPTPPNANTARPMDQEHA